MKKLRLALKKRALKTKWTMTVGITIFVSYAIISIILYIALQTWLIHNEEKNAERTVDDLTSFFEAQGNTVTIQNLQNNSALMKAILTQEQTVRIFNFDGIEVMQINDVNGAASFPETMDNDSSTIITKEQINGDDAFVLHQFVQIGRFQGVLQLIHPLSTFQSMMNYILTTLFIVGMGALLFSVSISYYLANLLMNPLKQLRDAMDIVRDQGFKAQPQFNYEADDEVGDLFKMYHSLMKELEISFTKQQQFVADASHELRTPIQVIEGHLSLLKRWGKDDPAVLAESLDTSLEEIMRMKKMIEELLQLARNEEVDKDASANIEVVYENVKQELIQLYPSAKIEMTVKGQRVNAAITEHALEHIFRNIMNNGLRYTRDELFIHLQIYYSEQTISVAIQDHGIGISEKQLPLIFERFYRVEESRTKEVSGTGLGLSITRMLTEKYKIEMNVESELNKGTLFILKFPVKKEHF
ncbi:two-component sensor histidine kinase [Lysinibacillus sp. 2017]|uniref:HAMP domain-containing sensor histidine kinase n=1 Tax=unclassified Lysinibacillus TaxID=2636778 RepID=UPI000D529902|nr:MULTISPECIES: HAMP domain-containing histidine kinase [unclassified Lysinibacillus]AWE07456.1 two-component sensor histidine kinase [Lysinibacillus sp. 2017]TGN36620.1 HAMP domain-containing histidine kinase [Lysinibacillus sp. S2017]